MMHTPAAIRRARLIGEAVAVVVLMMACCYVGP